MRHRIQVAKDFQGREAQAEKYEVLSRVVY